MSEAWIRGTIELRTWSLIWVAREFVARIGWLACRDGWRRRTTPSVTLDPRCRSRPMLSAVTASRNSGAGSRTGPHTMRPCASAGDRREIGGATAVGYIRPRSLTEGGCVAWVLRLVEIGTEGEGSCADVVEI